MAPSQSINGVLKKGNCNFWMALYVVVIKKSLVQQGDCILFLRGLKKHGWQIQGDMDWKSEGTDTSMTNNMIDKFHYGRKDGFVSMSQEIRSRAQGHEYNQMFWFIWPAHWLCYYCRYDYDTFWSLWASLLLLVLRRFDSEMCITCLVFKAF